MTDYTLTVSSYIGRVPWARHYKGRVRAEDAPLCCGNVSHFNAPEHRGVTTCSNGHVIPDPVEWEVEADMTEEDYERWAAKGFEGDSPSQFDSEAAVIDRAWILFIEGQTDKTKYWLQKIPPAEQGDRLFDAYGELIAVCNRG